MASKIILKKSSVAAKAPVAGDLDFGELAINYTDSKLYFKKADGSIDAFTSATAAVTSVGGNVGDITNAQLLTSIKNVDGTGSGLDADLLDGNDASAFYLATNPNGYTSNTGTVTTVGATSPIVSSGGNTPSLSIPAANSTTNGYMSSAYATKLDGIAAGATANTGTVTSVVAGTYLTGGTITSSGTIAVDATISNTASKIVARDASGNFKAGIITTSGRQENYGITTNAGTVAGLMGGTSGGTLATPTQTLNASDLYKISALGYTGSAWTGGAALTFVSTENFTSTNRGTNVVLTAIAAGGATGTNLVWNGSTLVANGTTLTGNTGTVTSVGGTGTVSGLTLSGTVTTSGNLTLGGTLSTPVSTINDSTTLGRNFVKLTNVAAISFPRINADNTVSSLDAATFRTAIGAGTSSTTGTVTSVGGTGTVSGLTLTGTVTTTGNLTLGGTLAVTASNFASQTANTVLAAPNGVAGVPTFRTLVAADVPTLNQNTTGSAGSITNQANSATIAASTTATANQIVLRDANGDDFRRYGFADYFNMTHGASGATTDTVFYSSNDNYIRKNNATGYRASLNVPTRTGGDASGTWGINITGNANTATTATNQSGGTVNATTASFSGLVTGASSASTDVNTANDTGSFSVRGSSTTIASMSFHRTGAYAINMGLGTDNIFRIGGWSASSDAFKLTGTGNLTLLGTVTAPTFSGALSGNATTATTATNQSGGTVNATGITFTGTQFITSGSASTYGATSIRGSKGGWSGISFYDNSNVFCYTLMARSSDGYGGIYNKTENGWLIQWDAFGNFTSTGNIVSLSDERLKTDWTDLPVDYIERLAKAKNGTYTRLDTGERQAGSSAQYWQKLLPEVVNEGDDDNKTLSLAYGNAALVSSIALAKRVVDQDKRIAKLEKLVSKLLGE